MTSTAATRLPFPGAGELLTDEADDDERNADEGRGDVRGFFPLEIPATTCRLHLFTPVADGTCSFVYVLCNA